MRLSEPYKRRKVNGQRISIHRMVMSEMLGRPLTSQDVVHHINGNTRDNRPENLQLLNRAEHASLHSLGRKHSAETRAKMNRDKIGNKYALGYKHTEETLMKRAARRGIPLSPYQYGRYLKGRRSRMKTYVLLSPNGETFVVRGLDEFCNQHGLLCTGIANVISGRSKHHKGWTVLEVTK